MNPKMTPAQHEEIKALLLSRRQSLQAQMRQNQENLTPPSADEGAVLQRNVAREVDQALTNIDVADLTRRFADLMFSYDTLQSFTFFGLSDRYTWLNKERPALWLPKMRALPLDDDMQHKPMWDALADALRGRKSLTIARSLAEARYLT